MLNRRQFLRQSGGLGLGICLSPDLGLGPSLSKDFRVRQITRGPKSHWFGYYDKWQLDPTGRFALGMEVDMPMRSPKAEDSIQIGMVDLQDNDRWLALGESKAWGWQQGCMLQWIPQSAEEMIWNDREGDQFVCHILNVKNGNRKTLPKAIYALSPDGRYAVGTEFNRIQNMRPGYGYAGVPDPYARNKAPQDIGIYRMDMQTGRSELIFSLAQAADIPYEGQSIQDKWHYFNHLLVSPDSRRLIFLHRWREAPVSSLETVNRGFTTRMFTINMDGTEPYVLDPSGYTSHFIWRDPQHICAWTKPKGKLAAFYLFKDQTEELEVVGPEKMVENGHNTYLPNTNNEWILNDTYPHRDPGRRQTLYLYHVPTDRKVVLGKFFEPKQFSGEWRCDLHPRSNQQGTQVIFDSTHQNQQRQMYLADISDIIS